MAYRILYVQTDQMILKKEVWNEINMLSVSSYLETFCHYQTLNGVVLRSRY